VQVKLELKDPGIELLSDKVAFVDTLNGYNFKDVRFLVKGSPNAMRGSFSEIDIEAGTAIGGKRSYPFRILVGKITAGIISMSGYSSSAAVMDTILTKLQVQHVLIDSVPPDISPYANLFVILGVGPTGVHLLSDMEDKYLTTYLMHGGHLYLETFCSNWYAGLKKKCYPLFNYSCQQVPLYYYKYLLGVSKTFTEPMYFNYSGPFFGHSIFNMIPKEPAFGIIRNTDTATRMMQFVYDGEDYKTIGSIFEFGLLKDSADPSNKTTLMSYYLDLFKVNRDGIYTYFHANSREVCKGEAAGFSDDSYNNVISRSWEFPGGIPSSSNDQDPVIRYDATGDYDVKLTVSDGVHSRSLVKKNYVHVKACPPADPEGKNVILYPNPSQGILNMKFLSGTGIEVHISIFDLGGRRFSDWIVIPYTGETFQYNISYLRKGMYFVKMQSDTFSRTIKMVVR